MESFWNVDLSKNVFLHQVRKQKCFVPIFLVHWELALAVSTLAQHLPFLLAGEVMSTLWLLLWRRAAPGSTLSAKQGKGLCLDLEFCCKHWHHQAWPFHLESNTAHQMLWDDSHGNESLIATVGYRLNTHTVVDWPLCILPPLSVANTSPSARKCPQKPPGTSAPQQLAAGLQLLLGKLLNCHQIVSSFTWFVFGVWHRE